MILLYYHSADFIAISISAKKSVFRRFYIVNMTEMA